MLLDVLMTAPVISILMWGVSSEAPDSIASGELTAS
jgi:hypothetical protein